MHIIRRRATLMMWLCDSMQGALNCLHCILAVSLCCGKDLGIIIEGAGLSIHFRDEDHSFVCIAGMVEESGAEECSETAPSLAADDVLC
jgi:hypothetical protein